MVIQNHTDITHVTPTVSHHGHPPGTMHDWGPNHMPHHHDGHLPVPVFQKVGTIDIKGTFNDGKIHIDGHGVTDGGSKYDGSVNYNTNPGHHDNNWNVHGSVPVMGGHVNITGNAHGNFVNPPVYSGGMHVIY